MKKIFQLALLLAGLGWLAEPCHAQSLEAHFRATFAALDQSKISSGILMQQTPIFLSPVPYDGQKTADSLRLSLDQFGMLYGQFRGAACGTSFLPEPSVYLDRVRKRYLTGDTVPLMFMATRYDYVRKGAMAEGLFGWADDRLRDVAARRKSPYTQDTCFAFTSLRQEVEGLMVRFQLPGKLIFNNLGLDISQVQVDFGDGRGFQNLRKSEMVEVRYPDGGRKTLTLRYQPARGQIFTASTFIDVIYLALSERAYPDSPDVVVPIAGCTMSFFYSCDDKKIRRPLIVAEGFGGAAVDFNKLLTLINKENVLPNNQTLKQWLNEREYDLIWIDWNDAGASISNNAYHLANAIEYINQQKHANGSSEPNVLIGASMGGLIGKYALLKMHNFEGKDSEVSKFFTYDSPLSAGANVPLGIQAAVRDVMHLGGNVGASTASFQGILQLLDSESAKDMVMVRVVPEYIDNHFYLTTTTADHDAFYNELADLEAPRPLSAITRHIALSNGASAGVLQENMPAAEIIKLYLKIDEVDDANAWEIFYNIHVNIKAWSAVAGVTHIYEQRTTVNNWINGAEELFSTDLNLGAPMVLDNAPGGVSDLGLPIIKTKVQEFIDNIPHLSESSLEVPLEKFCFIPSVGSLNNPMGTNVTNPTPMTGSVSDRATASTDASVSSLYPPMLPESNQAHVSMNPRIATIITNELEPPPAGELQPLLGSGIIYNFGQGASATPLESAPASTPHEIAHDVTVQGGGELWVNRNNRIAYINNPANPINRQPQPFMVAVPGADCGEEESVTVSIEDQSKFLVGQNSINNTGTVWFNAESELLVKNGGLVVIEDNSFIHLRDGSVFDMYGGAHTTIKSSAKVTVNDGSSLHVQSGATLQLQGNSQVFIGKEGTLVLDAGSIINLEAYGSEIRIEGTLVINGDITFQGYGYFHFSNGGTLEFGPGVNNFKLTGRGFGHRFMRLSSDLGIEANHGVIWRQGKIEADPGGLYINAGGSCRMDDVELVGPGLGPNLNYVGVTASGATSLDFRHCEFKNISTPVSTTQSNTHFFWICNFNNIENGIVADGGGGGFSIKGCTFEEFAWTGATISNRPTLTVEGSTWESETDSHAGLELHSVNQVVVKTSNFNSNAFLGPFTPDPGSVLGTQCGAFLDNVPLFIMRNSGMTFNTIGIIASNLFDGPSNVFLLNGSFIQRSRVGVYMDGTDTEGLVLMDCAALLHNDFGVFGTDVILMIDAINAQQHPLDGGEPNTFLRDCTGGCDDLYFSLCYVNKSPVQPIPMRENWWCVFDINTPQPMPQNFMDIRRANCTIPVTVNTFPPAASPPYACLDDEFTSSNSFVGKGPEADCNVTIPGGSTIGLGEAWHSAYQQLRLEDFEAAEASFQPVADLWQPDLSSYASNCQLYIQVAKAIVDGANGGDQLRPSGDRNTDLEKLVYTNPNPATGQLNVAFPDGPCMLRVYDSYGRLLHQAQAFGGTARLDVSTWLSGIYTVEVSGENVREQVKVAVQK